MIVSKIRGNGKQGSLVNTIPKEVRSKLGLNNGDFLIWTVDPDGKSASMRKGELK